METALADATQATGAVGDEIGRLVVGENDSDLLVAVRVITMNKVVVPDDQLHNADAVSEEVLREDWLWRLSVALRDGADITEM